MRGSFARHGCRATLFDWRRRRDGRPQQHRTSDRSVPAGPNDVPPANNQNFGFSNTNNAEGAPGEAGGTIERSPLAYYHDTTIGGSFDPTTTTFTFSGLVSQRGSNEYLAFHDVGAGAPRGGGGSAIGFRADNNRLIPFVQGDLSSTLGGAFPESFTFSFVPTSTGALVTGTIVDAVMGGADGDTDAVGTTPFSFTIGEGTRDSVANLTRFGIISLGESSGGGSAFYDNLVYTPGVIVPEPASLGLLAAGGLLAFRRRRA